MIILTILESEARIERFLHQQYPLISINLWRKALISGKIALNGHKAKKGIALKKGQTLSFSKNLLIELTPASLQAETSCKLEILFQNSKILALNKPANCHTHPLSSNETGTLANHLIAQFPELHNIGNFGPLQPALLNRLDYATSGIVLAARDNLTWQEVRNQFSQHLIRKEYLAEVNGKLTKEIVVEKALTHDYKNNKRMVPCPPAAPCRGVYPARTEIYPLNYSEQANRTKVKLVMYSGVMHQLRVHLSAIGHSIYGDPLYKNNLKTINNTPEQKSDHLQETVFRLHCMRMILADGLTIESTAPDWPATN